MKRYFWITTLFFLAYFRVRYIPAGAAAQDDTHYLNWVTKMVGLPTSISLENSFFMPGIALLWLPAGLVARFFSFWTPYREALIYGVSLTAMAMWGAGTVGMEDLAKRWKVFPSWWALAWWMSIPALFYAARRPTMAHAGEAWVAVLFLQALYRRRLAAATLFACLLTLIRINDIAVFLVLAGFVLDHPRAIRWNLWTKLAAGVGGIGFAIFTTWGLVLALDGYNGMTFTKMIGFISAGRFVQVFFGGDWGLLFTGPVLALLFFVGLFNMHRLSWTGRGLWLWVFFEILICLGWPDNGMVFCYRYMIGGYVAAAALAYELHRSKVRVFRNPYVCALLLNAAAWMLYLTWIYQVNPRIAIGPSLTGYGNPFLQYEAWRQLFHPSVWIEPAFLTPLPSVLYRFVLSHNNLYAVTSPNATYLLITTFAILTGYAAMLYKGVLCHYRRWITKPANVTAIRSWNWRTSFGIAGSAINATTTLLRSIPK